jgi:hypothetical protein
MRIWGYFRLVGGGMVIGTCLSSLNYRVALLTSLALCFMGLLMSWEERPPR